MLNVETRISLSKKSKRIINSFWKRYNGTLDSNSWTNISRVVKNEISKKLLANQHYKCAYCKRYLLGLGHEIDHFANKADNPSFSFNPTNLFYSCHFCNSSSRKGQKNVVTTHLQEYNLCVFSIAHPFFDNVDNELVYRDADQIDFDWHQCSDLGKSTIHFFGYDDLEMTTIRSRSLMYDRLNPLTTEQQRLLIFKAISYK